VILKLSYTAAGGEEAARAVAEVPGVSAEMKVYLRKQIAQGPSELLAGLVEAEVDGERLSEEEIRRFFQLLLIAGTETTTGGR
jgi:cytochrome P450